VLFPVFEEPSERGGREKTKAKENNDCNQNSHSERSHAASLVFAVRCPYCGTALRNDHRNRTLQGSHYAYRFGVKSHKGGR
jgi:hypothetical protein